MWDNESPDYRNHYGRNLDSDDFIETYSGGIITPDCEDKSYYKGKYCFVNVDAEGEEICYIGDKAFTDTEDYVNPILNGLEITFGDEAAYSMNDVIEHINETAEELGIKVCAENEAYDVLVKLSNTKQVKNFDTFVEDFLKQKGI